jgi:C-8 sterol isomerase
VYRGWASRLRHLRNASNPVLTPRAAKLDDARDVSHVFDPDELQALVRRLVAPPAPPIEQVVSRLHLALRERHGDAIEQHPRWVLNNAGGAMGALLLLHASVTEYLIVFGTPIGTEGHTGRFWADDWFIVLDGEQWAYEPGDLRRRVYRAGDMHHLPRGRARGYRIPEHGWALEYARGVIPSMMPFGLADALTSTLDWPTAARTLVLYAAAAARQLSRGKI